MPRTYSSPSSTAPLGSSSVSFAFLRASSTTEWRVVWKMRRGPWRPPTGSLLFKPLFTVSLMRENQLGSVSNERMLMLVLKEQKIKGVFHWRMVATNQTRIPGRRGRLADARQRRYLNRFSE